MNKSKIQWTDYTWNPVTGCLHGCEYCYARKIANRFAKAPEANKILEQIFEEEFNLPVSNGIHVLDKPVRVSMRIDPYPYGFEPTFHKYRLDEPQKIKKPSKIFVSSMGDLFGDFIPDEWIEEVFRACEAAPQHTYLFLTKNPKRYLNIIPDDDEVELPENWWFGATADTAENYKKALEVMGEFPNGANTFLSIEPLLENLEDELDSCIEWLGWVIIGQQTGPGAVPPKPEWVQSIIDQCRAASVPVFVKPPLYSKYPIQEWPEGLK